MPVCRFGPGKGDYKPDGMQWGGRVSGRVVAWLVHDRLDFWELEDVVEGCKRVRPALGRDDDVQ